MLLGDGHIELRSLTGNASFLYSQSADLLRHIDYFNHIFTLFKHYCALDFEPKIKFSTYKKTNKIYRSYTFAPLSLPIFKEYRTLFFDRSNNKIITTELISKLTFKSIAYWIMDDGSKHNEGLHLNTYGFSLDECQILMKGLENNFYLFCTIHHHKNRPRLYLNKSNLDYLRPQNFTIHT